MPSDKKNQGRYHLLIIFFIPINLVCFFLSGSIIIPILTFLISTVIVYMVLFRSSKKDI